MDGGNKGHPVDVLIGMGRFREAAWLLEHYLEDFPNDMATIANLGMCYVNSNRGPAAIALFKRALEIEPDNAKLLHNLGRQASDLSYHDDAIPALSRLIELQPDSADAHAFLAQSLRHLRRFDEAYAVYDRYPKDGRFLANIDSSRIVCAEMDERTTREHCMSLKRKWYADHKTPWRFTRWPNERDPEKKLTIGYVSGDFRSHSASLVFAPLLTERDRDQFKVVCIYVEEVRDYVTDNLSAAAEVFLHMPTDSDEMLAWAAYNNGVDILVDLSSHTPGTRVRMFTAKPAPLQISMIGAVGSTGIPDIDYVIADEGFVPSVEADRYAEDVYYLPSALHLKPAEVLPAVQPSPCEANGFVTFGCFQHFSKVTDAALQTWGDILRALPAAKILFKDWVCEIPEGRARILEKTGLPVEQIMFAGPTLREPHMADHAKVDVLLDTWPQNGGVTTIEAVAMGVPVISLSGDRPNQRGGASIARLLPNDVLVTDTVEAYKEAAIFVAAERVDWLVHERFNRRARWAETPLGDTKAWVRAVETAYREIWRRYCAETP